ncbi:MAG: hypothetical protein K6G80_06005 [Treponema sp.]|nr:hypothetical protein [Treponema sp.]
MKKTILAAAGCAMLLSYATAANLVITAEVGESLATWQKSDDDNDDNDGVTFFDHYLTETQEYLPNNNMSLSGESAMGGGELQLKWSSKKLAQTYLSGWVNVANPFGAPGTLTLKYGRFDAYPAVDFVTDANRGFHYQSYAVNPLVNRTAGFDPAVMNWFMRNQSFIRGTHSRVTSKYGRNTTNSSGTVTATDYSWKSGDTPGSLTSANWFFNDANNAGSQLGYYSTYRAVDTSMMAQYTPTEDLCFRFAAHTGSADSFGGAIGHDFSGEKTFTNWNAQVSYKIPEIAKVGLTVKMSDAFSGAWSSGTGIYESAGTDLEVALAASTDTLVPGLKLFTGYSITALYLGMTADYGTKVDLNETYLFHSIDLRTVYDIDELLSVGINGNVSLVNQSEYAKEVGYKDDYLGWSVGLSASYALSDTLAIDFNTGFRCLNMNNEVGTDRKDSGKTTEGDWLAVSSVGFEPSLAFTFNKNCAMTLGINVLIENLSGKDVSVTTPCFNHMTANGAHYPFTTSVTLPIYMMIRI